MGINTWIGDVQVAMQQMGDEMMKDII